MPSTPRIINIEENIGKTVGRRKPPHPLDPVQHSKQNAKNWCDALPVMMPPKGVYRFKTHEDADKWMTLNMRMRKPVS